VDGQIRENEDVIKAKKGKGDTGSAVGLVGGRAVGLM
jgi:hypothetical protein